MAFVLNMLWKLFWGFMAFKFAIWLGLSMAPALVLAVIVGLTSYLRFN